MLDEWEYEYGYPSSQSYDTPTKETTETSSKYIYPPPITYPKDDLKVIYAERLKPTYIPTVVGLLAPETPVTRTDLSDSTTKNSKPPGTECEKTSPRHNENGSTGVKPGGEPGAGGEKSAYSVQNVQESEKTTNVIPKVENVETMARKQKSENPGKKVRKDQKDRKSKKEKSTTFEKKDKNDKTKKTSKDKKTKNRNPVSQIDLVARWRDNVNNMMEGAQIGMSDRGEGPIEIGDKP